VTAAGPAAPAPPAAGRVRAALTGDGRARFGLAVIVVLALAALAAPLIGRYDPTAIDLGGALARPSGAHWMGTDVQGRDVWARLVHGARVSLAVGVASQAIALVLGVALGLVAGYYGRRTDDVVMRLADVTLAFPTLLLLIAMAAAFAPSVGTVVVTVGVVGWAGMARLVRGQVLVVRTAEYVQAERALGAGDVRIMLRHVLPNVVAPVVIAATLGVAGAIMAEAALSFLGLGVQPPTPSWGAMIADGRDISQLRRAPWTSLAPGLAIGLAVLGFNLLGDALRDALDPRAAALRPGGDRRRSRRRTARQADTPALARPSGGAGR
jgi:ABC-type dipeptide/oligopeptide/nickel transport system permease subunit